jgi:hypothetical protein
MDEEIELLKMVAAKLDCAGIEYMITGSVAMAFYAAPRMTRDIDLIIKMSLKDTVIIVDLFKNDFYIDENTVMDAVRNQGIFNIIHTESVIKLDFIVMKESIYRMEEFSRRKKTIVDNCHLFIVAPEDLILSKLVWFQRSESELQLRDVKNILSLSKNLDREYLEKWSQQLGVVALLKRAVDHV